LQDDSGKLEKVKDSHPGKSKGRGTGKQTSLQGSRYVHTSRLWKEMSTTAVSEELPPVENWTEGEW